MPLSSADVTVIVQTLNDSGWDEATVTVDDVTISVSNFSPSAERAEPTPEVDEIMSAEQVSAGQISAEQISSPSVGVLRLAADPRSGLPVTPGIPVGAGQVLAVIRVMGLELPVVSSSEGVISDIHTADGRAVEYGTALFTVQTGGVR